MGPANQISHKAQASVPKYFAVALVMCLGIVFSLVVFKVVGERHQVETRAAFERLASTQAAALEKEIARNLEVLESIGGLFATSEHVTRQDFGTFVSGPLSRHRNIQALSWNQRVTHSERRQFENSLRQEGYPEFQIKDWRLDGQRVVDIERPEYIVVTYIEPYESNQAALGFDVASNPTRLAALEKARDTGKLITTGRITLVQETGNQYGILIFKPIYETPAPPETVEGRWQHLKGFAVGVFRIGDMVEASMDEATLGGIDHILYDESALEGQRFLNLYRSDVSESVTSPTDPGPVISEDGLSWRKQLDVAGRRWSLLFFPNSEFNSARSPWEAWGFLAGGLLLTVLVSAYVLIRKIHTGEMEGLAGELSVAGEQLQAQATEMAVVDEVARVVTNTLDIDQVYEQFATEVKKLVDFERAAILVVDHDAGVNVNKYECGPHRPGRYPGEVKPMKGSQLQYVLETGTALVRPDISVGLQFPSDGEYLEMGLRSSIVVPLISKSRVVGMLSLRSPSVGAYGAREQAILERLASQIGPAIENAVLYEETRRAREQQRLLAQENKALAEIGRIVSSSLNIEEVYSQFSRKVSKLIPFDNMNIVKVDREQTTFITRYHAGLVVPGREIGEAVPLAGSATAEVVSTQLGYLCQTEDRAEMERRDPGRLPNFDAGLRSFLSVPLMFRDTVTGVLHLRSAKPNAYTDRDVALAERIGLQIAPALENARLYEETRQAEEAERQRSEELRVLFDVASILSEPGSFDEKAAGVMEKLAQITGAEWVTLRFPDQAGQRLRLVAAAGSAVQSSPPMTVLSDKEILAYTAFREGKPIVSNDYLAEPEASPNIIALGMKSMMLTPINAGGRTLGLVDVVSQKTGQFPPQRVRLLTAIVDEMGGLIENARLDDQRQRAEQELRESETRFRQISENMREVVFLVDHQDYKILYVNPAVEEIWGQTRERFYENPMIWIDAVHPDDRARVEAALNDQQTTGEFEEEFRIIRPDGTIRWIFDRAFPIRNEAGEVYRLVGIAEDITERKQTEERIQETARLASIGELAAGVAHEVNNPLTAVLGYSQLLMSEDLPDQVRADIRTVFSEAQRAAKIVQNLLSFSRRGEPRKQYIDLTSVLQRALEMKAYDFKVNNIETRCEISPDLPKTMVDEHQLIQVILNILNNSEQAILESGVGNQIFLRTAKEGDRIRICIGDNGPGLPPENMHKIFEPFFTTRQVGQGTGLGLSICYGIIRQHGGDIWAENGQDKGATFHIELPILAPEDDVEATATGPLEPSASTRHILVVDDEPNIRKLLARSLEMERYTVDLAEDGDQAWRKIQAIPYDCVVLDVKMPGLSGTDLFRLIQEYDSRLAEKVIFITGDTIGSVTHDFVVTTGSPVVTKPFQIEELRDHVRRVLEGSSGGGLALPAATGR